MDRKTLTIILAVALLGSFFLPFYSFGGRGASGLDIITAKGGDWQKYIFLIFPICGLLLLLGSFNDNYVFGRGLLAVLPLLALLYIIFFNPLINGVKFEDIFKGLGKSYGPGLWITIVTSLVLVFYNPKSR